MDDTAARNLDIVKRIQAGETTADLSRLFGLSRQRIHQIFTRLTETKSTLPTACVRCGRPNPSRSRYCSETCRRPQTPRLCAFCCNTIQPDSSHLRYCSDLCAIDFARARARTRQIERYRNGHAEEMKTSSAARSKKPVRARIRYGDWHLFDGKVPLIGGTVHIDGADLYAIKRATATVYIAGKAHHINLEGLSIGRVLEGPHSFAVWVPLLSRGDAVFIEADIRAYGRTVGGRMRRKKVDVVGSEEAD